MVDISGKAASVRGESGACAGCLQPRLMRRVAPGESKHTLSAHTPSRCHRQLAQRVCVPAGRAAGHHPKETHRVSRVNCRGHRPR